jgi:2-polyprenyl-3-methyl-5-hydroxy-6-metoxy-1,4-benzoquinol methylase
MTEISGNSGLQSDALEELVSASNYRNWLCSLGVSHFGEDVLEIGSGLGDYADDWARMGVRITASEADPGRLAALRLRFANNDRVNVRKLAVPITETAEHSTVVAYNVLEHIEDDVAALRSFAGLLRPGGAVVLIVPAFEFAMSEFDRAIGHHRRYRSAELSRRLREAGMTVERCHYINGPGLLAWYVTCRLLKRRPKDGLLLRAYDKLYVPMERLIESKVTMPFGQSLFAVARKP